MFSTEDTQNLSVLLNQVQVTWFMHKCGSGKCLWITQATCKKIYFVTCHMYFQVTRSYNELDLQVN